VWCYYTSTPQYVFTAWCFVKHRDNFTSTCYLCLVHRVVSSLQVFQTKCHSICHLFYAYYMSCPFHPPCIETCKYTKKQRHRKDTCFINRIRHRNVLRRFYSVHIRTSVSRIETHVTVIITSRNRSQTLESNLQEAEHRFTERKANVNMDSLV
jgi:hypothetical protein